MTSTFDNDALTSAAGTDLPCPVAAPTSAPAAAPEGGEGGKGVASSPPLPPQNPLPAQTGPLASAGELGDDVYRPAPASNPVIEALSREGLYVSAGPDNEHRIICPWAAEHRPGERNEALYFSPTEVVPQGSFYCACAHSEPRRIGALLNRLHVDRDEARCKPRIRVRQGDIHRIVPAAKKVLAHRPDLYWSNGRIAALKKEQGTANVTIEALSEQALTMHLSAGADWEKWDARAEEWQRCDVPTPVVATLSKAASCDELPTPNAVARQPYLRRGTAELVSKAGYDIESGVYGAFDPAEFSLPLPTRANAVAALGRLVELLEEFEFDGSSDRSTTLSAMLTASIRSYLPVAPGFNITASSPGSGKSYLASVLAPFAGPGDARNISYPATQEEATKVVLSLALEQPPAVCFDDMPTDWLPHGAINRMFTSGSITERKLGSNTVVTAKASSFIMGTGNNIRPLRDMARRVASIYILPQGETAATRSYAGRPADEVRRRRGQYVSDALTIIAAWQAAGSPKTEVTNIAGFEEWSDLCRQPLLWLGLTDPATSLIEQITHDPDSELLFNLLYAWKDRFGQRATPVREVLKRINDDKHGELSDAVMELPCVERGHVNQSRFGRYLARNKNRIVNGLKLVEAPHSERRAWAVVPVSKQPEKLPPVVANDPDDCIERIWVNELPDQGRSLPAVRAAA